MAGFIEWMKGKKTYFIAGAAAIVFGLDAADVISTGVAESAYAVLTMLGGVTIAAKINRLRKGQ